MAELFGVEVPAVSKHLKNIFETGELQEDGVISKMETTAADGKNYLTSFYNLDAIIAVGYRVNSRQATQFRIWATVEFPAITKIDFSVQQSNRNSSDDFKSSDEFNSCCTVYTIILTRVAQ